MLKWILWIIAVCDISVVLVIESMCRIVVLTVIVCMRIINIAVSVVFRAMHKFCMSSLNINARIVFELSLVVHRAYIIGLCVIRVIIHSIVRVILAQPVLEHLVIFISF